MTIRIVESPCSREAVCIVCRSKLLYEVVDVLRVTAVRIGDEVSDVDPPAHVITCPCCGRVVVVPEWPR